MLGTNQFLEEYILTHLNYRIHSTKLRTENPGKLVPHELLECAREITDEYDKASQQRPMSAREYNSWM